MRWRVGVAVLVALAAGVGGGWWWAASQDDGAGPGGSGGPGGAGPVAAVVTPVPAAPTLPVAVPQPDPDDPALEPGLPLVTDTLAVPPDGPPEYAFSLPVPDGWDRDFDGAARWTFTKPGNSAKTYGLRAEIIAAQGRSVQAAIRTRIAALQSAEAQGSISDFDYDLLDTGDGFDSTFTDGDGYDRISLERFYEGPEGAYATVAAYGRNRDRRGLADLVALITSGQVVGPA